tara:strand:+ start:330 stop:695 length:366 start_codon:yes stop_codon:yes gene_type:complete
MAITVIKTNQNIASSTIVKDTNANGTAADNTTSAAGSLYSIEVINPNTDWVYFKLADTADATAGTTDATLIYPATGAATSSVVFPQGIAFANGFSHWCVTAATGSSTTNPSSAVTVIYVTV